MTAQLALSRNSTTTIPPPRETLTKILASSQILTMEEFEIILERVQDGAGAGASGQYRHKNKPGETVRRILVNRGDTLSTRVTLALLGHGTITPGGEPASLMIFDFRLVSHNQAIQRFVNASFQLVFRDADGDENMDPDIYRIAPQGAFDIDLKVVPTNIKNTINLGGNLGLPQGGINAGYGHESDKVEITKRSVTLEGDRKVLNKGWGDDNAVIWTMDENRKDKTGTPSFLRAAVILRRKPGRRFAFSLEAETKASFSLKDKLKKLCHFGRVEHCVPVVDDSIVNPSDHVLRAEDTLISDFVKKINWSNLHELNLQRDLVMHTMREVMGTEMRLIAADGVEMVTPHGKTPS
ncbi:hypothetical protein F4677DRAFT_458853 [Hypoxylon crocopeplum]|nr:hypothetical protein F4677DRAFT_458853 [Hypoxylon crocopeplum]